MVLWEIVRLSSLKRYGQSEKIIGSYYTDLGLMKDRKTGLEHSFYPVIIKKTSMPKEGTVPVHPNPPLAYRYGDVVPLKGYRIRGELQRLG
jgi:hypothetical protein